jgi:integrase
VKGIEERHARSCRSRKAGRCGCTVSYRGYVWNGQKSIRYSAKSRTEVEQWLRDARIALRRGRKPQGRNTTTLREAWAEWNRLAKSGVVRTNRGDTYKPSAIRAYDKHIRMRVLDRFGDEPMADLHRTDWQTLVDDLLAARVAPATIAATVASVGVVYRHEISRGRLKASPLHGLEVPRADNGRERFASPQEAAALLSALPAGGRAVWATAAYAGLRCGELRALRARDVRLSDGLIEVLHGWDYLEGRIATKGRNRRKVPIPAILREHLAAELLRTGRRDDELLLGATPNSPFSPQALQRRADAAWKSAGLERLTPHDLRHTYASFMIAAGVNIKALSTFMGHSGVSITLDRYGHLLPGAEEEAAGLLDDYLKRSTG